MIQSFEEPQVNEASSCHSGGRDTSDGSNPASERLEERKLLRLRVKVDTLALGGAQPARAN